MDLKITNKKAYKIELLGILFYVIFIAIAMLTYAGGTQDNPSNPGYSFWFNTFSDTGRTVAHNGKPNITALIFFSIAISISAITLVPFFLVLPRLFNEDSLENKLTRIGGYIGILSSIAMIGVVFTPADILYPPHITFAILSYFSNLGTFIAYTVAIYRSKSFSNIYNYYFIIALVVFVVSLVIGLSGLAIGIRSFLTIGQKIGTIALLISYLVLTNGAWKLEDN